ncbi:LacI family DNA-binding transcriptional regulator [Olsenella massiliensis]|uniref:LacI family DNA-binding transcriptional regulator n=1 Tax=Olsenella massiliensis TaxID=1622075 RepID=UPI00071C2326|nr:LacI family DNA-binding transcriptional regulator [Olsenella massiliensis]
MAKVTLKDIAREVGLSTTAVSLVLNGRPNSLSETSRNRIKEAARRKRYVPNQIARSLVTQRTDTLGLIVPNIQSRFFSSLASSLERRCREHGYALFITNSESSASDSELVRLLVNRRVDGIFIVVSDELSPDDDLVSSLSQLPIPYVMVDRVVEGVLGDRVRFNNEAGGHRATAYLLDQGHRRIACLVNKRSNTGLERLEGYERALRERGVEPDLTLELQTDYYIDDAFRAARRLVGSDVTAVFASSDNIALGLLKRLYACGLRVPHDCSVVSYDNSAADALFEPALTSIEQNVAELSDEAFAVMLGRLKEDGGPACAIERILEPRLVEKSSVAPPRRC